MSKAKIYFHAAILGKIASTQRDLFTNAKLF